GLVREVEGDFVVQVRVGGTFAPEAAAKGETAVQRAGFLLADEKSIIQFELVEDLAEGSHRYHVWHNWRSPGLQGGGVVREDGPPLDKPTYLRVERKGDLIRFLWSLDSEK